MIELSAVPAKAPNCWMRGGSQVLAAQACLGSGDFAGDWIPAMKHRSTESSSVVAIALLLRVWSLNTARPGRARIVANNPPSSMCRTANFRTARLPLRVQTYSSSLCTLGLCGLSIGSEVLRPKLGTGLFSVLPIACGTGNTEQGRKGRCRNLRPSGSLPCSVFPVPCSIQSTATHK